MSKPLAIKEIKAKLALVSEREDPYLLELATDERKGVLTLLAALDRRLAAEELLIAKSHEMLSYERRAAAEGYHFIAGIDEVGRGPLAGPVVAAAVILPANPQLLGVNDSKQLSEKKRDELYMEIMDQAVAVGIGSVSETEIDRLNIYQATKVAMAQAVNALSPQADYLLLDAMSLESIKLPQESLIKGDTKSLAIAAASIVAKVTRDRLMKGYDEKYPGYDFANNAGYGTKAHLLGLEKQGPCVIHRRSFAPVKNYFN